MKIHLQMLKVSLVTVAVIIVSLIAYGYYSPKSTKADETIVSAPPIIVRSASDILAKSEARLNDKRSTLDDNILQNAPHGLEVGKYFVLGDFVGNNAKIIDRNNIQNDQASILQVTDAPNQLGAVWSRPEVGNYIDVSKDQTLSMWMYFGNQADGQTADGMAFVLQNNEHGEKQIATFKPNTTGQRYGKGESLGVWGTDFSPNDDNYDENDIAKTAIPHSFAIEFDTFANVENSSAGITGEGTSFDYDFEGRPQHIATGYPDSPAMYRKDFTSGGAFKNFFIMNHGNPHPMTLSNGKWHHMTITWHKSGNLTYAINDKNLDGTINRTDDYYQNTTKVDVSHFNLQDQDDNKLRWGFTGSTGKFFENNSIIFESVPSFVNATVSTSIYNESQQKPVTADDNKVTSGDNLQLNYTLDYLSGREDFKNILAKINLPSNVDLKSIEVRYQDGTIQNVNIGEINSDQPEFSLDEPLNEDNPKATVVVHVQANQVTQDTIVDTAHARFEGEYLILDTQTPQFIIKNNPLNLQTDPSDSIRFGSIDEIPDEVLILCYIWNTENNGLESEYNLHTTINGQEQVIDNVHASETEPYTVEIPKNQLTFGKNDFYVYAEDGNLKTTTKVISIYVDGSLTFGNVNSSVAFKPIFEGRLPRYVTRKNDWTIEVIDSRGQDNAWKLQLSASPIKRKKRPHVRFNGQIIYKDKDGNPQSLTMPTTIDYGYKTEDSVQRINVADNWDRDDGVLLEVNGKNQPGKFRSTLNWYLVDSI